jgi:imidazolonepropionase-like amidohydrolase
MFTIDVGTLVDGTDADPVEDARLVVDDGRVVDAGPRDAVTLPEDADHLERPDATVTPGLIDAHVHLTGARSMNPMEWATTEPTLGAARATADLRDLVAAGFTSVRDVGSETGIGLREAVAGGDIPGPRVYTSGQAVSQTAGHGDSHMLPYDWVDGDRGISTLADGVAECRKTARKRIREGVDCLKIMTTGGVLSEKDAPDQSQFTDEEIRAFTEEAHRVGIPVASHAQGAPGMIAAMRNGVDTIEHGFYVTDEVIEAFDESGATFVPTLAIVHRIITEGADHGVPEYGLEKARAARDAHFESTRTAYEEGVPIAVGTDFLGPDLVPHGENALELELLVDEVGMEPIEAIRAATGVAARTVPDDDVGTLTEGDRADFLVLGRDPTEDVSAVRDPETVYKNGDRVVG